MTDKFNEINYWDEHLKSILEKKDRLVEGLGVLSSYIMNHEEIANNAEACDALSKNEKWPISLVIQPLKNDIILSIAFMAKYCPEDILSSQLPCQKEVGDTSYKNAKTLMNDIINAIGTETVGTDKTASDVTDYARRLALMDLAKNNPSKARRSELDLTYVMMVTQKFLSNKYLLTTTQKDNGRNYTEKLLRIAKENGDPVYEALLEQRAEHEERVRIYKKYIDAAKGRVVSVLSPRNKDGNES